MFLDQSAAFDCVRHWTLLEKMSVYNFGPNCVRLIESYLSYRSQSVTVGGHSSEYKWIKTGVPQGSNLRPFLFSIYTQELSSVLTCECQHTNNSQETTTGQFNYKCDICRIVIDHHTQSHET